MVKFLNWITTLNPLLAFSVLCIVLLIVVIINIDKMKKIFSFIKISKKKISEDIKNKEYILYKEALKNCFYIIKVEVIRSFIENGFYKFNLSQFDNYMEERLNVIDALSSEYLMNIYPHDMLISYDKRYDSNDLQFIKDNIYEIYQEGKNIKIDLEHKKKEIEEEYKIKMNELSINKNRSCGDCLILIDKVKNEYLFKYKKLDAEIIKAQENVYILKEKEIYIYLLKRYKEKLNKL